MAHLHQYESDGEDHDNPRRKGKGHSGGKGKGHHNGGGKGKGQGQGKGHHNGGGKGKGKGQGQGHHNGGWKGKGGGWQAQKKYVGLKNPSILEFREMIKNGEFNYRHDVFATGEKAGDSICIGCKKELGLFFGKKKYKNTGMYVHNDCEAIVTNHLETIHITIKD